MWNPSPSVQVDQRAYNSREDSELDFFAKDRLLPNSRPFTGALQAGYEMFTKQAAIAFLAASQNAISVESTSFAANLTTLALSPCSRKVLIKSSGSLLTSSQQQYRGGS